MKPTMKFIVRKICGAVGVKCYYYPDYRKLTYQLSKHYTPDFKIPPIWVRVLTIRYLYLLLVATCVYSSAQ